MNIDTISRFLFLLKLLKNCTVDLQKHFVVAPMLVKCMGRTWTFQHNNNLKR